MQFDDKQIVAEYFKRQRLQKRHKRPILGKGIPEEHTPLLNTMLDEFRKQGFKSLQEFFDASQELNMLELGFISTEEFEAKATGAEREALEGMWR